MKHKRRFNTIIHLQKYNAQKHIMHHFLTFIDKNCTEESRIEAYKKFNKKKKISFFKEIWKLCSPKSLVLR